MTGFISMFFASVVIMGLITFGFSAPPDEAYSRAKPTAAMMLAWHSHAIAAAQMYNSALKGQNASNNNYQGPIPEKAVTYLLGDSTFGCIGSTDAGSSPLTNAGQCPFASFTDGNTVVTFETRAIPDVDGPELIYYLNEYTAKSTAIGWTYSYSDATGSHTKLNLGDSSNSSTTINANILLSQCFFGNSSYQFNPYTPVIYSSVAPTGATTTTADSGCS